MKLFTFVLSFTILAFTSCEQKDAPDSSGGDPKAENIVEPNAVRQNEMSISVAKPSETPTPPPQEVPPGTTRFLDYKFGFREVHFGQNPEQIGGMMFDSILSNFGGLVKDYTRPSDALLLNEIPLKSIDYYFYQNQLCEVYIYCELPEGTYEPFEDFRRFAVLSGRDL